MLAAIAAWPGAVLLRGDGDAYAAVSAAHILAIALLVGAALPMDLRLMGVFRGVPVAVVVPFLSRIAGAGLALAVVTGAWLWSVNPVDYVANPAFRLKAVLLAGALVLIAVQHANPGWRAVREGAPASVSLRVTAGASATVWIAVLAAGRWIGFV
jgi:hypothetical protein